MAPISLDQVRDDKHFNFQSLDDLDEDHSEENIDSLYGNYSVECNYYEPAQFHEKSKKIQNCKSYFHLNCRSLSSNWESFRELLFTLHDESFSFDFIGISEVFDCNKDQRLNLPGFHNIITRTRTDRKHTF
jgi:hypothetical protein